MIMLNLFRLDFSNNFIESAVHANADVGGNKFSVEKQAKYRGGGGGLLRLVFGFKFDDLQGQVSFLGGLNQRFGDMIFCIRAAV